MLSMHALGHREVKLSDRIATPVTEIPARASDCCYRNDRGRRRVDAAVENGPAQLLTPVMRERAEFRSMVV